MRTHGSGRVSRKTRSISVHPSEGLKLSLLPVALGPSRSRGEGFRHSEDILRAEKRICASIPRVIPCLRAVWEPHSCIIACRRTSHRPSRLLCSLLGRMITAEIERKAKHGYDVYRVLYRSRNGRDSYPTYRALGWKRTDASRRAVHGKRQQTAPKAQTKRYA
jgi:hypothetical protein